MASVLRSKTGAFVLAAALMLPAPAAGQPDGRDWGQPPNVNRTSRALQAFTAWTRQAGVRQGAIAVAYEGRVVGGTGVGGRGAEDPAPVASLSKAVTALCASRLVDAGRLRYDDSVGELLGAWFQRYGAPADRRLLGVTLTQLLTHRSGMVRDVPLPYGPAEVPRWRGSPLEEQASRIVRTPLQSRPGARYEYSNQAYILLSFILSEVSGRSYESLCREAVLAPVGGGDAFIARSVPQQARSGSGGWSISAADYARLAFQLGRHSPAMGEPTRRWLAARSLDQPYYGLGFQADSDGLGRRVIFHQGLLAEPDVSASALFLRWPNGWAVAMNCWPAADAALPALAQRLGAELSAPVLASRTGRR